MLIVCAIGLGVYVYYRADDELKKHVETSLAKSYPNLSISIGGTRLLRGEGIRIRDISVVEPGDQHIRARSEIAFIEEIFLLCDPNIPSMIKGEVEFERIRVRGLTIRAVRQSDGNLNLTEMIPMSCISDSKKKVAPITIENANVEFIDRMAKTEKLISLSRLNANITPKYVKSSDGKPLPLPIFKIVGSCSSNHFSETNIDVILNPCNKTWIAKGNVSSLKLSPNLYRILPVELTSHFDPALRFQATSNVAFTSNRSKPNDKHSFVVKASVTDGRYENPMLERAISNIETTLQISNQELRIPSFKAQYGATDLSLTLSKQGLNAMGPFSLTVNANNLRVDRDTIELLPPAARKVWQKFQPLGVVSGYGKLRFDGHRFDLYESDLQCRDLSLLYHKFQYPIGNCRGRVTFKKRKLDLNLVGSARNTPISITGEIYDPLREKIGWCRVQTEGDLQIDDALILAAIKHNPKLGSTIQKLHPRGQLSADCLFSKQQKGPGRMKLTAGTKVDFRNAQVQYESFPYPISDVKGRITLRDGRWEFQEFQGFNDGCFITCNGFFDKYARVPLDLRFVATKIPLDEELKSSFLSERTRQLWHEIRPIGFVGHAQIDLTHIPGTGRPNITVKATLDDPDNPAQDLRINHKRFPYSLQNIKGYAVYQAGHLSIRRFSATNKSTVLTADLIARWDENGSWNVRFEKLSGRGIRSDDDELMTALPKELSKVIDRTKLTGDFLINGSLGFSGTPISRFVTSDWDVILDVHRANFQTGIEFEDASGEVRLKGKNSNGVFLCRGNIELDTVMHRGNQFANLHGPYWTNGERILIGANVPREDQRTAPLPLEAVVHEGILRANIEVNLSDVPEFRLQSTLSNASLASMARDIEPKHRNVTGQVSGKIDLSGNGLGIHSFEGKGNASLRDANLGELPVILAVVERLRTGKNDSSAFNSSEIQFQIDGSDLLLDKIVLSGDAITLKGIGRVGYNRDVDLSFYSIVGQERFFTPVLRPIIGEASRQFLEIKVGGTLDQPTTRQDVLPGVSETIGRFFPEQSTQTRQRSPKRRFSVRNLKLR